MAQDYKDDNTWLMLGDCLERMKEIPDGSVDAIICDPPYGTTQNKWDSVIDLPLMWEQLKRVIKPNGAIVLFGAQPFTSVLIARNLPMFKYCWAWEKTKPSGFLNARIRPLTAHEDIAVFYASQCDYNPQGLIAVEVDSARKNKSGNGNFGKVSSRPYIQKEGNFPRSVLKMPNPNNGNHHPTQKPVALMEYLIKTYTNEGETVLDFTFGSNTTGVACKNLNRKYIGIEMDENYFNIGKDRMLDAD